MAKDSDRVQALIDELASLGGDQDRLYERLSSEVLSGRINVLEASSVLLSIGLERNAALAVLSRVLWNLYTRGKLDVYVITPIMVNYN